MNFLPLWIAALLALLASSAALIRATLESKESDKAESIGFVRLVLTGVFGVVIGQAVIPFELKWWWSALISISLMVALLIGSQLLAKALGHKTFGVKFLQLTQPLVNSTHLLFTPISLPKSHEPEQFEQELLDSVEEFGETIVREIMVPRIDMATVAADASLAKAMTIFLSRGYSRLPVIGKTTDDIRGVLYLKDVARLLHEAPQKVSQTKTAELARVAIFVPESKPVDDLLREMQLSSTHIAVIVDEYGGVAGLATMEDVIEEIVGEISDEYDLDVADVEELAPNEYRVNARYSLIELGELFEIELDDEDVDSVGGLLTKELGRLPVTGDAIKFSGLVFSADRIENRRKRLITVLVSREKSLADAQSAFEQLEQ